MRQRTNNNKKQRNGRNKPVNLNLFRERAQVSQQKLGSGKTLPSAAQGRLKLRVDLGLHWGLWGGGTSLGGLVCPSLEVRAKVLQKWMEGFAFPTKAVKTVSIKAEKYKKGQWRLTI